MSLSPELLAARDLVRSTRRVVILTGAGVSAESGVPTFRGPAGHWKRFRPEDLATPEAFRRDPCLVWSWYDHRRQALAHCAPNPGHGAVARYLEANPEAHLVTQNVDGLHQRAMGSADPAVPHPRIHELHGSIARLRCSGIAGSGFGESRGCTWAAEDPRRIDAEREESLPRCPSPGCGALLRPDVDE